MIKKHPMMNIMAASAYDLQCILDVVDWFGHMADGGIKDACYVASQYLPVMAKLYKIQSCATWWHLMELAMFRRGVM